MYWLTLTYSGFWIVCWFRKNVCDRFKPTVWTTSSLIFMWNATLVIYIEALTSAKNPEGRFGQFGYICLIELPLCRSLLRLLSPWAETISTVHGSKHCLLKQNIVRLFAAAELWFNCDVGSCDAQLSKYSLGLFCDMASTNETHVYARKISRIMQAVTPVIFVEEAATGPINFNGKPNPFLTSDASPWNQTWVSQLQMLELNNDIWMSMFHQNLCEPTCECFVSTRGKAVLFTESFWPLWSFTCWRKC